ncbi:prenyltransferase/squalene oxidase repeat-containing protein [Enhygromyxa salina]|uniref:Squalene--hopene cyclase n=1 Tax=Enhygromyxa salina TaxID=215803 RepID=A0A2S9YJ97_9BACT|nr:prenyltransferase/squalene oxidase repeat-containing protein [Enhygromyxa salina]PRQ05106.1 Squalene--hopene cyclase [Enhygromyxa salina]
MTAGGPLDAALARSQAWCQTWWARLHQPQPWLAEIPDVGPSCEVLLADALFHDLTEVERQGLLAWIRSQQHQDGSWRDAKGEPDVSLTCLGYWARVQAGDDPDAEDLVRALRVIHELGGARQANLSVRLWLAMAGTVEWDWVPSVPSELYLLPEFARLSPARLSPWARQMVTALHLLASGPARIHLYDAAELLLYNRDDAAIPPRLTRPGLAGDLLQAFDTSIRLGRKLPRGVVRRRSLGRARRWIEDAQQAHGGWFSTRPTIYSLMALRVAGVTSDDPRVRSGLDYLRRARGTVEVSASGRVLAQGLTGRPLAKVAGLGVAAGIAGVHERLLAAELTSAGPWQRRADAPIGGWSAEADADAHLDLRTTCTILHALRGTRTPATRASLRRAAEIVLAMQEPDGSFARFERGEATVPLSQLPWRDAEQLNLGGTDDEARVVLTAMVLRELAVLGWRREDDRIAAACAWLERTHARHGHAWSVATLAEVVRATVVQCVADHPLRKACEQQLRTKQREDGSFGDELSTARALLALIAVGDPCAQAQRAARNLVGRVGAIASDGPNLPDTELPGYGLSPRLRDPSAGARAIHAALSSFRREVGQLA